MLLNVAFPVVVSNYCNLAGYQILLMSTAERSYTELTYFDACWWRMPFGLDCNIYDRLLEVCFMHVFLSLGD